jgi:DNA-binding PadR family transcriptional regulator
MSMQSQSTPLNPISESTFFILLCLAGQPRHGYAIMKEVSQLSQERVRLSTGTLYGAINRLLELGWIERVESMESSHNGRGRKEYRLTRKGKEILAAETRRLRSLLSSIDLKLGGEIS